jgi:hypothetical protein
MEKEQQDKATEEVKLSQVDYDKLLDHIDDLEGKVIKSAGKEKKADVDDLAEEGRRRPTQSTEKQEPLDLESLTNADLARLVIGEIQTNMVQPLLVTIHRMDLEHQIEKLTSKDEYKDFWDYKDEIYELAKDNPKLPLEKVYKLAKENFETAGKRKPTAKNKDDDDTETPEEAARRLRRTGGNKGSTHSEKPGPSKKTTTEGPMSARDAATRAWDEVFDRKS